jgi:hypothetical protein
MREYIKLADCKPGYVYRISSRNLGVVVFSPEDNGFIGIREKFGEKYLFTEYHYDTGPPFGTVFPLEEIGPLPPNIRPVERLGTFDRVTMRPVAFDKPVADGGKGWYFVDTGEASDAIRAANFQNDDLFEYLSKL